MKATKVIPRLKEASSYFIKTFGLIWLMIEASSALYSKIKDYFDGLGGGALITVILVSFALATWKTRSRDAISFKLKETNTNISIKTGNLFYQHGYIVVSVTQFFDSKVDEQLVAPQSIHGKFIIDTLNGDTSEFDKQIKSSLIGIDYETIGAKKDGKQRCYPIGTTAVLHTKGKHYLILALSEIDIDRNYEAHAPFPVIANALDKLWIKARSEVGHDEINIPLVGGGLGRSDMPPNDRLEIILLSLKNQSRQRRVADTVNIILYGSDIEQIDLTAVMRKWS